MSLYGRIIGRRLLVKFERGYCFLVDPAKNVFNTKPKAIRRINSVTLAVTTGFLYYGKVSMRFDSLADADKVESGMNAIISRRHS